MGGVELGEKAQHMGRPLGRKTGPSGDLQAVHYVWNIERERVESLMLWGEVKEFRLYQSGSLFIDSG